MKPSLSLSQFLYGYQQPLFEALELECFAGEIWAILGANGRGKTTLLDTLTKVRDPLGGSAELDGGIAFVPQSFHASFNWLVQDVVLMGRASQVKLFSQPSKMDEELVREALNQLKIEHLATTPFHSLSGGQQQLVLIARALVSERQNILLDEPCSALDLSNQQAVLQLIYDLAAKQNRTVLFTTHDPMHATQLATHVLLLLPNKQWLAGKTSDILTKENLQLAYGVPIRQLDNPEHPFNLFVPQFQIQKPA
ncbi:MAG: ABC transporter ATP-binding protein [Vibrio sp.]